MDKNQLRIHYTDIRNKLDDAQRKRASSLIRQKLFQHTAWRDAERILCYVSFRSEVDTHMLIQEGIRFKKKMCVPIFLPQEKSLTPLTELNRWGNLALNEETQLLEPRGEAIVAVDPATVQLVLTPGIAFDRQGNRIGFGGGYFDRLFTRTPNAKRIGLAFSEQISANELPHESHDVRMHSILTEKEEILFDKV